MEKISTIHDAVRESVLDTRTDGQELKPTTCKIQPAVKEKAEQILRQNGTSVSSYLRWCLILLVEDYHPGSILPGQEEIEAEELEVEPETELPVGRSIGE